MTRLSVQTTIGFKQDKLEWVYGALLTQGERGTKTIFQYAKYNLKVQFFKVRNARFAIIAYSCH